MLQVRLKTLQKNNWERTPDKNGPDIALLQLFPENVSKWVPGGGPGEGPRTTFSQPFSVLSPMGSPGSPGSPKLSPRVPKRPPGTAKTNPRGCQNAPPDVPSAHFGKDLEDRPSKHQRFHFHPLQPSLPSNREPATGNLTKHSENVHHNFFNLGLASRGPH